MFTKKAEGYLSARRKLDKAKKLLGLPPEIAVTEDAVRDRFVKLAREGHPDASDNPDKTVDLNKLRRAKDTLIAYLEDEKND